MFSWGDWSLKVFRVREDKIWNRSAAYVTRVGDRSQSGSEWTFQNKTLFWMLKHMSK